MKGWKKDSYRHKMAKYGIKTASGVKRIEAYEQAKITGTPVIIVDIDGTIFDTSERFELASEEHNPKSPKFWDAFMDTSKIKLDKPIKNTAYFLSSLKHAGAKIIYLSGRRTALSKETRRLLDGHGYPQGKLILRPKGVSTVDFKVDQILKLRETNNIKVYIGNEKVDEEIGKITDIPTVKVRTNKEWSNIQRREMIRELELDGA